jgi:hypothetical protein
MTPRPGNRPRIGLVAAEYEGRHAVAVIIPGLAAELVGSEGPDVALPVAGAVPALHALG